MYQQKTLSKEQEYAFNQFIMGHNLFITGPGGTGKSELIKTIVKHCKETKCKYQVCAITGCATVLLGCGARTLHSWSGIRLARGPPIDIVKSALKNRNVIKGIRNTQVLIIDEVSMMSKKIFEIVEEIVRSAKKVYDKPFGGMQVIFTGDFFQLPPVGTEGEPDTYMFCFESPLWKTTFKMNNHIELKTMFRQNDPLYIDILKNIRKGTITEEHSTILSKYVNREFNPEENNGCVPSKLFPVKSKTDYVNNEMYKRIDSSEYEFAVEINKDSGIYVDSGEVIHSDIYRMCKMAPTFEIEREIEAIIANANINKLLKLKIGTVVMCTKNISVESGICNGSQGVVTDIINVNGNSAPVVKFHNGKTCIMEMHRWQSEEYPTIVVSQYPLMFAWASTIHKIQGATLNMAVIDIGHSVFEYGQAYVALSRIKSLDGLYLLGFNATKIKANPKVIEFYNTLPNIEDMQPAEVPYIDLSIFNCPETNATTATSAATATNSTSDPNVKKCIIPGAGNGIKVNKITADKEEKEECCICMDKIEVTNNCVTPCGHRFCLRCILKNMKKSDKCPLCRVPL